METIHRQGSPGFMQLDPNTEDSNNLEYPEYSEIQLYQTSGDLSWALQAGLVFPDFDPGNVLYVTVPRGSWYAKMEIEVYRRAMLRSKSTPRYTLCQERSLVSHSREYSYYTARWPSSQSKANHLGERARWQRQWQHWLASRFERQQ